MGIGAFRVFMGLWGISGDFQVLSRIVKDFQSFSENFEIFWIFENDKDFSGFLIVGDFLQSGNQKSIMFKQILSIPTHPNGERPPKAAIHESSLDLKNDSTKYKVIGQRYGDLSVTEYFQILLKCWIYRVVHVTRIFDLFPKFCDVDAQIIIGT